MRRTSTRTRISATAGQTRRALLDRLKLAAPVGAGLVLWALSLQRGPGAAVAFPARQRRPHDRGSSTAAGRMARSQAPRAVGWRALSPGPSRPGGRESPGHQADAAAGLQP